MDRYVAIASSTATRHGDASRGLLYAARGLLGSPNFVYRIELGEPDPAAGGRYRYRSYELASRLSYLLTASTPDAPLLAAAGEGKLETPDGLRAEATRILGTDAGKRGFATFAREFFTLDDFIQRPTDDPRYTASLRQAMAAEIEQLYATMIRPGQDVFSLFDTSAAFVNDELAKVYGITGITSKTIVPATLPPSIPRVGILGRGPFLAGSSADKAGAVAPILRGLFVADHVLCKEIPPPPPGVVPPPEMPGMALTPREQLEQHRADPGCAACHALFDPLGLVFETFDAIGQYRERDPSGKAIDTAGELAGVRFKDAKELAGLLRQSEEAERCFVKNLFWYALGHVGSDADRALQDRWHADFKRVGRDLSRLLPDLVASDGFRFVSVGPTREGVAIGGGGSPGPGNPPTPPAPTPGEPPPPGNTSGPTPAPGQLDQLCDTYCKCMGSGRCSSRNPSDCLNTCKRDGNKWALACRADKCRIAQTDYVDQIDGDCSAAVGIHACWNEE